MVRVCVDPADRINQGDIYANIDFVEKVVSDGDEVTIQQIVFPLAIVLTQDCDLEQDSRYLQPGDESKPSTQDKQMLSVIVAPIYNEDLFLRGEHLDSIGRKMQVINKTRKGKPTTRYQYLVNNSDPRYHHLKFDDAVPIPDSVIDFKHYFTLTSEYLDRIRAGAFVCKVGELYRELITQRFANFLSRIGLPAAQSD